MAELPHQRISTEIFAHITGPNNPQSTNNPVKAPNIQGRLIAHDGNPTNTRLNFASMFRPTAKWVKADTNSTMDSTLKAVGLFECWAFIHSNAENASRTTTAHHNPKTLEPLLSTSTNRLAG